MLQFHGRAGKREGDTGIQAIDPAAASRLPSAPVVVKYAAYAYKNVTFPTWQHQPYSEKDMRSHNQRTTRRSSNVS